MIPFLCRLQVHLKERMHALEEKNVLSQELERCRKTAEELQMEKTDVSKELGKARLDAEAARRALLQQEIAFNIQQTDALTRSLSPGGNRDQPFSRSTSHTSFDTRHQSKVRYLLQCYFFSLSHYI